MALAAPRSLKEPMGCRFSSFSQISAGAPSAFRRTSGVRRVTPARRSRAARISSMVGAVRGCMARERTPTPRYWRRRIRLCFNRMIHQAKPRAALLVLGVLFVLPLAPAAAQEADPSGGDDPGAAQAGFWARLLPAADMFAGPALAA